MSDIQNGDEFREKNLVLYYKAKKTKMKGLYRVSSNRWVVQIKYERGGVAVGYQKVLRCDLQTALRLTKLAHEEVSARLYARLRARKVEAKDRARKQLKAAMARLFGA